MTVTLEEWLTLPRTVIAAMVAEQRLTVKLAIDGSRRHYLLHHPNEQGEIVDAAHYLAAEFAQLLTILDILFSCGVENMVLLAVWPPDLTQRTDHLHQIVDSSKRLLLSDTAVELFQRLELRVALYGDFDISPALAGVRDELLTLRHSLRALTANGKRSLVWGYSSGSGLDEVIARTVLLYQTLGRMPTEAEVRAACFPDGPERIDVYIGSGRLEVDNITLPVLLKQGCLDMYHLAHLALDLTEGEVRRILYDRIFRRSVSRVDNPGYTPDVLTPLRAYYTQHAECVVGLGQLIGNTLWCPDHDHRTAER